MKTPKQFLHEWYDALDGWVPSPHMPPGEIVSRRRPPFDEPEATWHSEETIFIAIGALVWLAFVVVVVVAIIAAVMLW